jgi:hypothetical protein
MSNHINIEAIRQKRTRHNGEPAYDVQDIGKKLGPWTFELDGFDDSGVLYFDSDTNRVIQSIGERFEDCKIIASLLPDLYGNQEYKCIWLM